MNHFFHAFSNWPRRVNQLLVWILLWAAMFAISKSAAMYLQPVGIKWVRLGDSNLVLQHTPAKGSAAPAPR